MNLNTIITRGEDYLFNEIDGEVVMMNIETGSYVSLNPTGKSIWDLLNEAKSIDSIIDSLLTEYNIDRESCEKDVVPFIQQMVDQKIVVVQ